MPLFLMQTRKGPVLCDVCDGLPFVVIVGHKWDANAVVFESSCVLKDVPDILQHHDQLTIALLGNNLFHDAIKPDFLHMAHGWCH